MTDFKAKDRYGAEMEFSIKSPNRAIESEAETNYRIAYGKGLKLGLMTRESMRKLLKENDIWTGADETRYKEILLDLAKLEIELKELDTSGNQAAATVVAGKLATTRKDLWQLILIQQSPFTNSCEAYSELVRMESQMAASVIIKANGKRYWTDYKEYVLERDTNEVSTVATAAMELTTAALMDEQNKLLENNPEQQWLKNIKLATEEAREAAQVELNKRAEAAAAPSEVVAIATEEVANAPVV